MAGAPREFTGHIGLPWAGNWVRLGGALGLVPSAHPLHPLLIPFPSSTRSSIRFFFVYTSVSLFRSTTSMFMLPFLFCSHLRHILPDHLRTSHNDSHFRSTASSLAPTHFNYDPPLVLSPINFRFQSAALVPPCRSRCVRSLY